MPDRLFRSSDGRFGLRLPTKEVRALLELCRKAGKNEVGGILVGRYTSDHDCAVVHEVSGPPEDSRSGRTWFNRGVKGLQRWLDGLWSSRRYYLGEWHFHPYAPPDPSGTDISQMASIAESPGYKCPEPALLILGGDPTGEWSVRGFVYAGDKLIEMTSSAESPRR